MSCRAAPACSAVREQATQLWPKRSQASDGICASAQHHQQNPGSDHEPDARGIAHAVDLTHDPAHGCNVDIEFEKIRARRDARVKYLIRARRICRSYDKPGIPAWTSAPYTGPNPHKKHGHCSILPEARNDVSPWFASPHPAPPPAPQEDDDMFILNPVTDEPDTTQYFVNGDEYVPLTADEAQQFRNSGFQTRDMEPLALRIFKRTAQEISRP